VAARRRRGTSCRRPGRLPPRRRAGRTDLRGPCHAVRARSRVPRRV